MIKCAEMFKELDENKIEQNNEYQEIMDEINQELGNPVGGRSR